MNNVPRLKIKKEAAEQIGMDKSFKEKRKAIQEAKRKAFEERESARREELRLRGERNERERSKKKAKKRAAIDADMRLAAALTRYEDTDTKALKHAEEELVKIRSKAETLWRKLEATQSAQIDAELKLKQLRESVDEALPALEAAWEAAEAAWAQTDKAFRKNPAHRNRKLKKQVREILE